MDVPRSQLEVDPPDADVARLCFALKRALDLLLENVRQRGQSVRALWMRLSLLRSPPSVQRLEPSAPTRDAKLLLELLRLRLTTVTLDSPVVEVSLEAETADQAPGQLSMFVPKRDLAAGDRALARLKASYGEDVVCRAELSEAHLPEAKFRWVEAGALKRPRADEPVSTPPSRRRSYAFLKKPVAARGMYGLHPRTGLRHAALSKLAAQIAGRRTGHSRSRSLPHQRWLVGERRGAR